MIEIEKLTNILEYQEYIYYYKEKEKDIKRIIKDYQDSNKIVLKENKEKKIYLPKEKEKGITERILIKIGTIENNSNQILIIILYKPEGIQDSYYIYRFEERQLEEYYKEIEISI